MRLVHSISVVMAKLVDYLLDLLMLSLEHGIADNFLEPGEISRMVSMHFLSIRPHP